MENPGSFNDTLAETGLPEDEAFKIYEAKLNAWRLACKAEIEKSKDE